MCGRYEIVDGKRILVRFKVANAAPAVLPNLDVRPTQQVPVLLADHQLTLMRWGLAPAWAKDASIGSRLINARAEGIAEKPSFKRPLRSRRCLLPASAFFEWRGATGAKVKYRITRCDGELFGLAGLYDVWKRPDGLELTTCTIITCQPNSVVAPIHNRMPVILLPDDEEAWLDPDMTEVEAITSYLRPYPAELLEAVPAA
jgi:putative SOS response-associated peptidase YedK